jgi:hypothetical protein
VQLGYDEWSLQTFHLAGFGHAWQPMSTRDKHAAAAPWIPELQFAWPEALDSADGGLAASLLGGNHYTVRDTHSHSAQSKFSNAARLSSLQCIQGENIGRQRLGNAAIQSMNKRIRDENQHSTSVTGHFLPEHG